MDRDKLIALYAELYALTNPACSRCEVECPTNSHFKSHETRCCEALYCEKAERYAKEKWGIALERVNPDIPFLGSTGCVVPAYLRPICSHHICQITIQLTAPQRDRYWEIRRILLEMEQSMGLYPYPGDVDS